MQKIEYIWVDGTEPSAALRSKTKVINDSRAIINLSQVPVWGFDGSSTNQAPGDSSDCALNPVRLYDNPLNGGKIAMCEVMNIDGTPHETNTRSPLKSIMEGNEDEPLFGLEQEYTLLQSGRPLGWPSSGEPPPQGDYYCGRNAGEDLAQEHLDACIRAGISMTGINSEVMLGQWEYQVGAVDPLKVSDDIWVARWIMEKIAAKHGASVSLDPKPKEGDWNGAGCHTNFSTKEMRERNGESATGPMFAISAAIDKLAKKHVEHISVYGAKNDARLTGLHETCPITKFRSGVSDRGASVRIPWQVARDGKGYLEDRRPAANCDPYVVCHKIIETVC